MRLGDAKGYKDDLLAIIGGYMDLPERYGVGLALHATEDLTLAVDYLRINWGDVSFLNNPPVQA